MAIHLAIFSSGRVEGRRWHQPQYLDELWGSGFTILNYCRFSLLGTYGGLWDIFDGQLLLITFIISLRKAIGDKRPPAV